ncbi:hypothetical protein AAE478_005524 [Parahypoxylon ruwenzoriense]
MSNVGSDMLLQERPCPVGPVKNLKLFVPTTKLQSGREEPHNVRIRAISHWQGSNWVREMGNSVSDTSGSILGSSQYNSIKIYCTA